MATLIATIILVFSLAGIIITLFQKIPVLAGLPKSAREKTEPFWRAIPMMIKNIPGLKSFSFEIFLQKILSRIRILVLRMENKIAGWLQKLRENNQRKKTEENDNYWQEVKKNKNKK